MSNVFEELVLQESGEGGGTLCPRLRARLRRAGRMTGRIRGTYKRMVIGILHYSSGKKHERNLAPRRHNLSNGTRLCLQTRARNRRLARISLPKRPGRRRIETPTENKGACFVVAVVDKATVTAARLSLTAPSLPAVALAKVGSIRTG
jgi:hypothetical protein